MRTDKLLVPSIQELLWKLGPLAGSRETIQERAGSGQGSTYNHFRRNAEAFTRIGNPLCEEIENQSSAPSKAVEWVRDYVLHSRCADGAPDWKVREEYRECAERTPS
jgi:hypothetical protein